MRFDILLAIISSGVYAPLGLMAFGLLLAAGGGFFLWRRRKKAGTRADQEDTSTVESAQIPEGDPAHSPAAQPQPKDRSRRRPLVAGEERAEGTPSGSITDAAEETAPSEPLIEEAEFEDYVDGADEPGSEDADPDAFELDHGDEDPYEVSPATPEADLPEGDLDEVAWVEDTDSDDAIAQSVAATGAMLSADRVSSEPEEIEELADVAETQDAHGFDEIDGDELDGDGLDESALPPLSAETLAAQKRPIVFRQFLPQSIGKDGLSFYGGAPIGPAHFQWPRERGAQGGAPLQFVMQWDCSQLFEQDPTGLLPQDGVLYCFVNFGRDQEDDFLASHSFIYEPGPALAWLPIDVPDDAGPVLGEASARLLAGCTDKVDNALDYTPRILPRFPFAPVALQYPVNGENAIDYWSDDAVAGALLDIQKSGVAVRQAASDSSSAYEDVSRPFPAFPHDFGAIRVIASRMIEALEAPDDFLAETLYPSLSADEREEQFAAWTQEAQEVFMLGTQRPWGQKLDQAIADDIWQWFEERKGVLAATLPALVAEAVDLSLSVNSDALSQVPAHWIDRAMRTHALATEYGEEEGAAPGNHICAATPARMFGPASYSKTAHASAMHDHILLLELPSGAGPQHNFEGKVLQYWITPDDLAAGKLDAVKSVIIDPAG